MAAGRVVLPPYFPARDRNGRLVPGALLTVRVNETTTLAPVWTNEALSVAQANPISANSSGRFPDIWAEAGTEADPVFYTLEITDADGKSIGNPSVFDNYRPSVDFETATLALAEAASDSASADAAAAAEALAEILDLAQNAPDAPSIVNKANRDGGNITDPDTFRDNLELGSGYSVSTVAELVTTAVPVDIAFVSVGAYATGDTGGPWILRKVGSTPSHSAYLVSADGAIWEFAGDKLDARFFGMRESNTAALNAPAFTTACLAAAALNRPLIVSGNYNLAPSFLTLPEGQRLVVDFSGSTITAVGEIAGTALILTQGSAISGSVSTQFPDYNSSAGWSLSNFNANTVLHTSGKGGATVIRVQDATNFIPGRGLALRQQRIDIGQNRGYTVYGERNRIKSVTPVTVVGFPNAADIELELPLSDSYNDSTVIKTGTITARTSLTVTLNTPTLGMTEDEVRGSRIVVDGQQRYVGSYNTSSGVVSINTDPTQSDTPAPFSPLPTVGATFTIDAPTYVFLLAEPFRPTFIGGRFIRDTVGPLGNMTRPFTFYRCYSPKVTVEEVSGFSGSCVRFEQCLHPYVKAPLMSNDSLANSNGIMFISCNNCVADYDHQVCRNIWQSFDAIGDYVSRNLLCENFIIYGQTQENNGLTTHGGVFGVTFRNGVFYNRGGALVGYLRGVDSTFEGVRFVNAPADVGATPGTAWLQASSGESLTIRNCTTAQSGLKTRSYPKATPRAGTYFVKVDRTFFGNLTIDGLSGDGLTGDLVYYEDGGTPGKVVIQNLDLDITNSGVVYAINGVDTNPIFASGRVNIAPTDIRVNGGGYYGGMRGGFGARGNAPIQYNARATYAIRIASGAFQAIPCPADNAIVRAISHSGTTDPIWAGDLRNPNTRTIALAYTGSPTLMVPTQGPFDASTATASKFIIGIANGFLWIKNGTASTWFGVIDITPTVA